MESSAFLVAGNVGATAATGAAQFASRTVGVICLAVGDELFFFLALLDFFFDGDFGFASDFGDDSGDFDSEYLRTKSLLSFVALWSATSSVP